MIGISTTIAGTVAASDSSFGGFTSTPAPFYVNGKWWSLTSAIRSTAPRFGIASHVSIDDGVTWTLDDITWDADFPSLIMEKLPNNFEIGDGLMAFPFSTTSLWKKDLDTPNSKWIKVIVTDLGGWTNNPTFATAYYDDINAQWILDLDQGSDLYTSTDLVTFTSINGTTKNTLNAIFNTQPELGIRFAAGKYVASKGFEIASSTDLLTWVPETNRPQPLFNTYLFNGTYIDYPDGDLNSILTSTDLITWTFIPRTSFVLGADINGIRSNAYVARYVTVTNTKYTLVGIGFVLETTDGVTFTAKGSNFNFTDALITFIQNSQSYLPFAAHGRACRLSADTAPNFVLLKTLEEEELGGKILKFATSMVDTPTLQYAQNDIGFTKTVGMLSTRRPIDNAIQKAALSAEAFTVSDGVTDVNGFYHAKNANRYLEVEVISTTLGPEISLGLEVVLPNAADSRVQRFMLFSDGVVGNSRLEVSNASVQDISLPTFVVAPGQILGFEVSPLFAQLTIYLDGVQLIQIPNMLAEYYWKFSANAQMAQLNLNVGQDPFINQPAGTIPWANENL